MPSSQKVAVVTGSNKGIGYSIVKGLCEKFQGDVFLTARNEAKGKAAVDKLKQLGFNPLFVELDIVNQASINSFKEHIQKTYGGIDILVNNAAICFPVGATEPFGEQAEKTLAVNYFGTLKVCDALFPLLRQDARVLNISSSAGHLSRIPSEDVRNKFSDPNLTIDGLNTLVKKFIKDAKENKHIEQGWGNSAYVVSKVAVTALTKIQQRIFDQEKPYRNVSVNAVHPGYVNTDINEHHGSLTTDEGARAPLYLALEANLKGQYVWYDNRVVDWTASSTPTRH